MEGTGSASAERPSASPSLRADAAENRSRILAAARDAFATEGPQVPIREIARRAGVSAATVHRRFPTKEALRAEAFAEAAVTCSAIVEEGLDHPDPWLGLGRALEELLRAHAADPAFRAAAVHGLAGEEAERDRATAWRGLLELVRRAQRAGAMREDVALEDLVLALMANEGLRAQPPAVRVAAARRLAALLLESFRATRDPAELPPRPRLRPPTR